MKHPQITIFNECRIQPCAERLAQQARGLFGWHDSESCPDCVKTPTGCRAHSGRSIFAPLITVGESDATLAKHLAGRHPEATITISDRTIYYTC